jgi:hypothetical protein
MIGVITMHFLSHRRALLYAGTALVILFMVLAAGCTRQAASPYDAVSGVMAYKTDESHITVTYAGDPGMAGLIELEITVSDSSQKNMTRSRGDRLGTATVKVPSSVSFTGNYADPSRVVVTAYFSNGSYCTIIDKKI